MSGSNVLGTRLQSPSNEDQRRGVLGNAESVSASLLMMMMAVERPRSTRKQQQSSADYAYNLCRHRIPAKRHFQDEEEEVRHRDWNPHSIEPVFGYSEAHAA